MQDVELLEKYRQGCDDVFGELVRRHIGWVYGLALRRVRDHHLADDISQSVFILLHRKLPRFKSDRALVAWLYKTAGYAAEAAGRARSRRSRHEARAALRSDSVVQVPESDWNALSPVLDEIIGLLSLSDREAILLRYYQKMTFEQLAIQIGTTAEAARKRVDRAIDKMRAMVNQRGIACSTVLIGDALTQHVAPAHSANLATTVIGTIAHGSAGAVDTSAAAIVKATATIMNWLKFKLITAVTAGILVVGGVTTFVVSTSQSSASAAADAFPKLSPFSAVSWNNANYRVKVDGKWYGLLAINDLPATKIIDFAQKAYSPGLWQKRIDEDLVEVMTRMGAAPGNSVKLTLQPVEGGAKVTLDNVAMTSANRWAVWDQRNKVAGGLTTQAVQAARPGPATRADGKNALGGVDLKVSPFSAVRWKGDVYQVEVAGKWYELNSIEGEAIQKVIGFAKRSYMDIWQKRIDEDFPEVLGGLGHPFHGSANLELRTLDTHELIKLADVPMTSENRWAIWKVRNGDEQKMR